MPRKIHAIDTGLVNHVAFHTSPNYGHWFETMMALELIKNGWRTHDHLFYYRTRNGREVDLVIRDGIQVESLIQFCHTYSNRPEREQKALWEASDELRCSNLVIVTWDHDEELHEKGKTIHVMSALRWLAQIKEKSGNR